MLESDKGTPTRRQRRKREERKKKKTESDENVTNENDKSIVATPQREKDYLSIFDTSKLGA